MKKILLYTLIITSLFLVGCDKSNDTDTTNLITWDNTWANVEQPIEINWPNEYIPVWSTYVGKKDLYKIYFDNTYWKLDNQSQFAPSDFVFYNQDDTLSIIVFTDNTDTTFDVYVRQELDRYNQIWSWYTILSSWSGTVDGYNYIDVTFENTQQDIQLTNRIVILKLDDVYLNLVFVTSSTWYQWFESIINWFIKGVSLTK